MSPNTYELNGDGVQVKVRLPKFTQIDAATATVTLKGKAHDFSGNQISVENTKIGAWVSVTIETVPDSHVTTFAWLLPSINLVTSQPSATGPAFHTMGVSCLTATTIAGPPKGVDQTYTFVKLEGVSSLHPQH